MATRGPRLTLKITDLEMNVGMQVFNTVNLPPPQDKVCDVRLPDVQSVGNWIYLYKEGITSVASSASSQGSNLT